ncbi:hypothetical protein D1AOALGA4SA_13 [Olavius algarvensis Delta 1 endosymbiont]|nr:hypothetical protein D1AOALGA4SA_13 [Olavius algarvensis Delta 1 endosymbiont]
MLGFAFYNYTVITFDLILLVRLTEKINISDMAQPNLPKNRSFRSGTIKIDGTP